MMVVCVRCGKEMQLLNLDVALLTDEESGRVKLVLSDIYICECGNGIAISKGECRVDKKEEIVEELFYL